MTKDQENKLSMYYSVQKVCNENNTIWNGLGAFVTAFGVFEGNIVSIKEALQAQEEDSTGVKEDKDDDREEMVDLALEVGKAVIAYASDNNNNALKNKVNYSRTDLLQVRDSISIERAQLIHDEAEAIVGDLGTYGVNGAKLTELQNAINDFTASNPGPRDATIEKKGATSAIADLQAANDIVLEEKMDGLMEQFKKDHPKFYEKYFDARIIVDLGTRTTFVEGVVLDAATATPIVKASIKLVLDPGTPEEEIRETETGELGEYQFESMKAGEAKLRGQKVGYKDVELNIVIERGKANVFELLMEVI